MTEQDQGRRFAAAALMVIRAAISPRDLYVALYEAEPSRQELQAFRNRLNPSRGNPGADFIGLCADRVPALRGMTLGEFFGIAGRNEADGP